MNSEKLKVAVASLDTQRASASITIPKYLQDTYWWAYLHPNAVRVFERQPPVPI